MVVSDEDLLKKVLMAFTWLCLTGWWLLHGSLPAQVNDCFCRFNECSETLNESNSSTHRVYPDPIQYDQANLGQIQYDLAWSEEKTNDEGWLIFLGSGAEAYSQLYDLFVFSCWNQWIGYPKNPCRFGYQWPLL